MRTTKKPEERRQEIIEAALELFLEKGYESVSIKDITTKVNVAAGLFYYYFHSKEEVFMECVKLDREKYVEEISHKDFFPSDMGTVEKINRLMMDILQNISSRDRLLRQAQTLNSEMLFHQVRDYAMGQMSERFAALIQEGNEEGVFHCKYPQTVAEIALFGLWHHFIMERERHPDMKENTIIGYVYAHRNEVREIVMDVLEMKEPHGLFDFDFKTEETGPKA